MMDDIAAAIKAAKEARIQCRCDFDNYEPERFPPTGHTSVCPIHKFVMKRMYG